MLIFDFDGTIADTMDEALRIVNSLAPKYGIDPIDSAMAQELRGLATRDAIKRVGIKARMVPKLIAELKLELRGRIDAIQPVPGIVSNLQGLKERGVEMGILTSNSKSNVETFLANCGLTGCFSFLETGSRFLEKRDY